MKPFSGRIGRYGSVLLFPLAMIIYDFSAYLTTDLIQPGVINIINELQADVTLAPASVSLYMAGGLALQWLLGPLSDRIGRRPVLLTGAMIFALACLSMLFVTSIEQYFVARFIQGTSICFISTVGYVSIQEAFDEKDSIRIMAALTSIVLLAPIIGPVAGGRRCADGVHSLETALCHHRCVWSGSMVLTTVQNAGNSYISGKRIQTG